MRLAWGPKPAPGPGWLARVGPAAFLEAATKSRLMPGRQAACLVALFQLMAPLPVLLLPLP